MTYWITKRKARMFVQVAEHLCLKVNINLIRVPGGQVFIKRLKVMLAYDVDYKIGYPRTEEHCAQCGGHLGHVF